MSPLYCYFHSLLSLEFIFHKASNFVKNAKGWHLVTLFVPFMMNEIELENHVLVTHIFIPVVAVERDRSIELTWWRSSRSEFKWFVPFHAITKYNYCPHVNRIQSAGLLCIYSFGHTNTRH